MNLIQLAWHIICYTIAAICALVAATIAFGIGAIIGYMFSPSHAVAVVFGIIAALAVLFVMFVYSQVVRSVLDDVWPNRP